MDLGEDELAELTLENQNLLSKVKKLEESKNNHVQEVQILKNEISSLKNDADQTLDTIHDKTNTIQSLRDKIQLLNDDNSQLKRKYQKLEQKVESQSGGGVSEKVYKQLQSKT